MNELTYTMQGDYNLPDLTMPKQPEVTLGRYAQMRRKFLREHHKIRYYNLLTSCTLFLRLFIPCTHFIIYAAFRLSVKPSCTAICFIRVSSSFIAVCSVSAKCCVRVQLVRRL